MIFTLEIYRNRTVRCHSGSCFRTRIVPAEPFMLRTLTTASAITAAKAVDNTDTEYRVSGVKGLVLRVYASGAASFWFYYRRGSKLRKIRIGDRGAFELKEARREAAALFARVERGEDPAAERATKRSCLTFKQIWEQRAETDQKLAPSTRTLYGGILKTYVWSEFGDKPADTVTNSDVRAVINRVTRAGYLRQADMLSSAVSSTYKWACGKNLANSNPAVGIPKSWTYIARTRVVGDLALPTLYGALNNPAAAELTEPMCDVLALTLLTFCRRTEIVSAQRSAVDLDKGLLRLEGDTSDRGKRVKGDTKNSTPHIVPLSTQALALFQRNIEKAEKLPTDDPRRHYVFPGDILHVKLGKAPRFHHIAPDSVTRAMRRLCETLKIGTFSPHDLRRTAATWAGDNDVDDGLIDRLLNHVPSRSNVTLTTYNLARKIEQRRVVLQAWADYLDSLLERRAEAAE